MTRVNLFISSVSDEFGSYRDKLRSKLQRPNVTVHVQEDFIAAGTKTLEKLDDYIKTCDAVVHLVGDMTGAWAHPNAVQSLRARYPDIEERLGCLSQSLSFGEAKISYTQWEAYLAIYHGKKLFIAVPERQAQRDKRNTANDMAWHQAEAQLRHLAWLRKLGHYPEIRFANSEQLISDIALSSILELLAKAERQTEPTISQRFVQIMFSPLLWIPIGLFIAAYLAGEASFAPPWPSEISIFGGLLSIATLAFIVRSRRFKDWRRSQSLVFQCTIICAVATACYLMILSLFMYETPDLHRLVKGFICSDSAAAVYKDKCPLLGIDELREAEYIPERLWTQSSIAVVKLTLAALWLIILSAGSVIIGNFATRWMRGQASPSLELEAYRKRRLDWDA